MPATGAGIVVCDVCKKEVAGTDWKWYQDKGYHIGCMVAEVVRLREKNKTLMTQNDNLQYEVEMLEDELR